LPLVSLAPSRGECNFQSLRNSPSHPLPQTPFLTQGLSGGGGPAPPHPPPPALFESLFCSARPVCGGRRDRQERKKKKAPQKKKKQSVAAFVPLLPAGKLTFSGNTPPPGCPRLDTRYPLARWKKPAPQFPLRLAHFFPSVKPVEAGLPSGYPAAGGVVPRGVFPE